MVVKRIAFMAALLSVSWLYGQNGDSLARRYLLKMHAFIDRDHVLSDFYTIDRSGVAVFAGKEEKAAGQPEYFVKWNELPVYRNMIAAVPKAEAMRIMKEKGSGPFPAAVTKKYAAPEAAVHSPLPGKPLNGYRIAIDPGHIAADTAMGKIEEKYLSFWTRVPAFDEIDSEFVTLVEGMMTWETADSLAAMLRRDGAEVLLTRNGPGMTAFGKTFMQWKKDDYQRTLDSLLRLSPSDPDLRALKSGRMKDDRSIFRFVFRDAELRKRAELINAFHPDLTLIIHFNVDETNTDWKKASDKNYCMAFVGGSFQAGELSDPEKRFDFLRLLLTDDMEESTDAAGLAANEFTSELEVPLAQEQDATYLRQHSIPAGPPGVFCRNLSLTRSVEGPLVYGETLYQDNHMECMRLSSTAGYRKGRVKPLIVHPRLMEVATAYHNAVLDWAKTR